jgi:hypothetical protein
MSKRRERPDAPKERSSYGDGCYRDGKLLRYGRDHPDGNYEAGDLMKSVGLDGVTYYWTEEGPTVLGGRDPTTGEFPPDDN